MASINKPVYFNVETEKDLLKYADSLGKRQFSQWVKEKLRQDMIRKGSKEIVVQEVKIEADAIREDEIKQKLTTQERSQLESKKSLVWNFKK